MSQGEAILALIRERRVREHSIYFRNGPISLLAFERGLTYVCVEMRVWGNRPMKFS